MLLPDRFFNVMQRANRYVRPKQTKQTNAQKQTFNVKQKR